MNMKAVWVFLALTFGFTLALVIVARLKGLTFLGQPNIYAPLVLAASMFIPALSAVVTQKFVAGKPLQELGFKWGPWHWYAKVYGIIVSVFLANYVITWIFIKAPDFTLNSFVNQFTPPVTLHMPAPQMIFTTALITFVGAPVINMIPCLGEEIGWRGFLLPNLQPLGKVRAMVISGMIWGLWHTPMILILGFCYGGQAWPGALLHFALVTSLGIFFGYVWFKTRSTVLVAFMHATFNANAYGVWMLVFVSSNNLIVGPAGLVSVILWSLVGAIIVRKVCLQDTALSTL